MHPVHQLVQQVHPCQVGHRYLVFHVLLVLRVDRLGLLVLLVLLGLSALALLEDQPHLGCPVVLSGQKALCVPLHQGYRVFRVHLLYQLVQVAQLVPFLLLDQVHPCCQPLPAHPLDLVILLVLQAQEDLADHWVLVDLVRLVDQQAQVGHRFLMK